MLNLDNVFPTPELMSPEASEDDYDSEDVNIGDNGKTNGDDLSPNGSEESVFTRQIGLFP